MEKKLIYKIGITIVAILVLYFGYTYFNNTGGTDYDGSITFKLVDENGNEVVNDVIYYKANKEDGSKNTLFDILGKKYNLVCANAVTYEPLENCSLESNDVFGKVILEIEGVKTDWKNSYLAIYKNDVYANYGVSTLEFKDKDVIEFRVIILD